MVTKLPELPDVFELEGVVDFTQEEIWDGFGVKVEFVNGYIASVIQHQYSYGGDQGLFEGAVLTEEGLCYDTPITDDVVGRMTLDEVREFLTQVKNLPRRTT